MRREREWSYHTYRRGPTERCPTRQTSRTIHNTGNSLPIAHLYIPALSELKRIKETKIRRIRDMVRKGIYDTIERQIETARRIADILLAEKDINN